MKKLLIFALLASSSAMAKDYANVNIGEAYFHQQFRQQKLEQRQQQLELQRKQNESLNEQSGQLKSSNCRNQTLICASFEF